MPLHPIAACLMRSARALTVVMSTFLLSAPALAGEVSRHAFPSPVLGDNYPYTLYLPDGYQVDAAEPYPVVYMLHGSFGNEHDWVSRGQLARTVDRLIDAGHLPPAVFVMPGSRSWWVDGYNEPARRAFFDDLMPHIETTYRVGTTRAKRGVAGLSAGGYGALNFALERPDLFAAVAALSPASYVPAPPRNSSAHRHPAFLDAQGEFDQALWQRLNYPAHLEDYRLAVAPGANNEPSATPPVPLYISAGRRDEFDAEYHARQLRQAIERIQPGQVRLDLYPGGHTWRVWRASLPAALTFLFQYVGAEETPDNGEWDGQ